jgi:ABC-type antimicrobial peptide transport system permease subunit
MALGARSRDVLGMILGQGLRTILMGVVAGAGGALALTRAIQSLLFGVEPTDPLTFFAVTALLVAVATLACYVPARRATRVDPMVTLRCE